ncbi:hypothetical protein SUGI_0636460 [Cryptomeria japonica]|nr:hypothetical protein SUGI_0636460 [Cryptomeria japonica]
MGWCNFLKSCFMFKALSTKDVQSENSSDGGHGDGDGDGKKKKNKSKTSGAPIVVPYFPVGSNLSRI